MNKKFKILISGGGTGGHIFPAISIARALQKKHPNIEFLFVGANHRMEMEKVPEAGYEIIGLPVTGFNRSLSLKNLSFFPNLISSLRQCKKILKDFNPDIVIGVGGFASGPILHKAQKMGIPTVIQEQNSYAGVTNKLLAKKANKICVAYDNMDRYFPNKNILMTGNPIRNDILNINNLTQEAKEYFKLNTEQKTVLIVGGSLGARTINESIAKHLDVFIRHHIQIIWQTGKYYYTTALDEKSRYQSPNIQVHKFIKRMDLAYAAADFIISRAGAGTISELCVVGKPVILVPSPNVSEDHQTKNAMALVNKNAALIVKDAEAKELLVEQLLKLEQDNKLQNELSKNIKQLEKPNADEVIAEEILKLIK